MGSSLFAGKVLLFGEYGIIKGSMGLAVPLSNYNGKLKKAVDHNSVQSGLRLDEFCGYLEGSSILSKELDLVSFSKDIQEGQYFDSNIPHGYGVGSSGALCAAVYAKYGHSFSRKDFYSNDELKFLKDMMALMESFYHGSSSGMDCLISLIDKPLLIEGRNNFSLIPKPNLGKFGKFYLLDSGKSRKTSSLVHDFLSQYGSDKHYKKQVDEFVTLTNKLINHFSNSDAEEFDRALIEFSKVQLKCFSNMIPEKIRELWLNGLETKNYTMKLCGAGGGGFFLVYTNKETLPGLNCELIEID
jgi:mevalonate kinase